MKTTTIKLKDKDKIMIVAIIILASILLIYAFNPLQWLNREKSATIYSHVYDGYIYESDTDDSLSDAWDDVIDDDDGTIRKTGDIYIGSRTDGGNATNYRARIYRGFLMFDTRNITGSVTSVKLRFYVEDIQEQQEFDIHVQIDEDFIYPSMPLDSDDYEEDLYSGDYGSMDSDDMEENDFSTITLDNTVVNKGGWTKICLRSSRDIDDNRNANNKKSYIVISSGDDDDNVRYPALLINT